MKCEDAMLIKYVLSRTKISGTLKYSHPGSGSDNSCAPRVDTGRRDAPRAGIHYADNIRVELQSRHAISDVTSA